MQISSGTSSPTKSIAFSRYGTLLGPRRLLWAAAVLVAVVMLLPIGYLVVRALETDDRAWQLLFRTRTLAILGRTVGLAGAVTLASTLIAVPLAWLTTRTDLPLRRVWSVLTPLPLVIPSYVGAYLFASALGPRGLLQQWLEAWFGVERLPSIYGFWGALLVLTLLSYPYMLLAVRAALLRLDPVLEEASRTLGRNAWRTFALVTLPLLRPAIGAGGLLVALYVIRDFGAVSLMRFSTFTSAIYNQYLSFDRSLAALYALVLVAVTLCFLLLEGRTQRQASYYQGAQGALRSAAPATLGFWRWPAFLFCLFIVGIALLLPAGMLVYWLVRGIGAGEVLPSLRDAAWNSTVVSLLAAITTVLATLPVAVLLVRFPGRGARVIGGVTWLAYALPGIVIALSLVFLGANHALWLYQTLPMLLLAYGILFAPQAIGTVRTSLDQIHPSLEEAGRSLGRGAARVFATITLPLARPGLVAGAAMVFLTTMKELPATLLLAPLGFRSLAMVVWSSVSEAYFSAAAAPALLIVLLSSVPMAILLTRGQHEIAPSSATAVQAEQIHA